MKVHFFGVRGSVPVPSANMSKYGGNTSAVLLECEEEEHYLILDGGTGLRYLGNYLLSKGFAEGKGKVDILFTHFHWDHIQGFPFFIPAYIPGNKIRFFDFHPLFKVKDILENQQKFANFPVSLDEMGADFTFKTGRVGSEIIMEDIKIDTIFLNHPGRCVGYRIFYRDKSVAYITDIEHSPDWPDKDVLEFVKDSNILIYDAMFIPEDYEKRIGWGHSTYYHGAMLAKVANIGKLFLFHYSPDYDDNMIDEIAVKAKKIFFNTFPAKEGLVVEL